MMPAFEDQSAVNLVGQNESVAIANRSGDLFDVALRQYAACGVLRRIQNDQLGSIADQVTEFVGIQSEVLLFAQANRHCAPANIIDHGLIDWKARVGIDDLVTFINEGED